MKCVVLQPSYIPWRGYFDQIQRADTFIFYDDVQYDKHGWRNRNKIKTANGTIWLTIPVISHGNVTEGTPINEIKIRPGDNWRKKHLTSIQYAYSKAPFFDEVFPVLEKIYKNETDSLSDFTIESTIELARFIGIDKTKFLRSSELSAEGRKTDRLLAMLGQLGVSHYISGPSAKSYIEYDKFEAAGITLEFMEYNYPEYEQLYPPFEAQVSVIDLLFMLGKDDASLSFDITG